MNNIQYGWHVMRAGYEDDCIDLFPEALMLVKITPNLLEDIEYVRSNLKMLINDHPRGGCGTLEFCPTGMRMELMRVPSRESGLFEEVINGYVDMALLDPDGGLPDRMVELQKTKSIFTTCVCPGFKVTAGTAVHSSDIMFTCIPKHADRQVNSPNMSEVFFNE